MGIFTARPRVCDDARRLKANEPTTTQPTTQHDLVLESRDQAEAAMAIVAAAEVQKKEIDSRAARYRKALCHWVLTSPDNRAFYHLSNHLKASRVLLLTLRHGLLEVKWRDDAGALLSDPLVIIKPNSSI